MADCDIINKKQTAWLLRRKGSAATGSPQFRESDAHAENEIHIDHARSFPGWNSWKETIRQGMDCAVRIRRDGNRITMNTENLGIAIDSVTTLRDHAGEIYIALTGDQCTLTNIRVAPEN